MRLSQAITFPRIVYDLTVLDLRYIPFTLSLPGMTCATNPLLLYSNCPSAQHVKQSSLLCVQVILVAPVQLSLPPRTQLKAFLTHAYSTHHNISNMSSSLYIYAASHAGLLLGSQWPQQFIKVYVG